MKNRNTRRNALSFSSESLLREAIIALLSRIPTVSLIQETHGGQEVGKDIIFYESGGLGERALCACVVKNAPLTGRSASSKSGALTIINQIEQSLLNPKKMEYGMEVPIHKVYVITPYDLSDTTLNAIFGHIKNHFGRIEFIGGTRLFELFRKHWPDFFADEFTAIREYIRSTSKRLQQEKSLQQVALNYRLGAPDRTIARYYVQPNFHQRFRAIGLNRRFRDIVHQSFSTVTYKKVHPDGREEWIPVTPRQVSILPKDVRQCHDNYELCSVICDFLTTWEYCDLPVRNIIVQGLLQYSNMVRDLRNKYIAATTRERSSILVEVSKNSIRAELSRADTLNLLDVAATVSKQIDLMLVHLQRDITTTIMFIRDKHITGLSALNDPRYRIAVKLQDMYDIAPPELFAPLAAGDVIGGVSEEYPDPKQPFSRQIDIPNSFLDDFPNSVMIVGAAGYGKTSFCRWHVLNDAEKFAKGDTYCVPAYIGLHEIARGELKSFEELFLEQAGHSALLPASSSEQIEVSQQLRLYLDGLDEIPSPEMRKAIVDLIYEGLTRWPNIQIVLTARDYIVGPWLSWLPKFRLSGFTQAHVEKLLTNWFDTEPDKIAAFKNQLEQTSSLSNVLTVPLLATLVILVFRLTGNLPSSRKRLYEIFVELLNAGWDLAKGVHRGSQFGPVLKLAILKRIAYTAHDNRIKQISEALIKPAIRTSLRSNKAELQWREVLNEIIRDGLLEVSGATYTFSHLSFQEFLSASTLTGDPNDNRRNRILKEFLGGDNWWKEVLCFYLEISSNIKELYEWITTSAAEFKTSEEKELAVRQSRILLAHLRLTFPDLAM